MNSNRYGLRRAILLSGLLSAGVIAGAWYFQLVMRLAPCALCLEQRWPHYIAMAVAALGVLVWPRWSTLFVLALLGLMLWSTGLAIYHAGVEWAFWQGPAGCSAASTLPVSGNLLDAVKTERVPSCTEALWRLFGVSLAGWNALASVAMALWLGAALARAR